MIEDEGNCVAGKEGGLYKLRVGPCRQSAREQGPQLYNRKNVNSANNLNELENGYFRAKPPD